MSVVLLENIEHRTGYRRVQLAVFSLFLFGVLNIILTYPHISHVYDEAPHVATGMEWWDKHQYTLETLHPPFARIMAASLLYVAGNQHALANVTGNFWYQGAAILHADGAYILNLILARLGVLPFYILSCLLIYRWSRELFGESAAVLSLALYVTLPVMSGHAGLATTDMPYAAMLVAGIMMTLRWLKNPVRRETILLGVALALMVGSKYSALVHWPVAMLSIVAVNGLAFKQKRSVSFVIEGQHWRQLFILVHVFFFAIFCLFWFSFTPFVEGIQKIYEKNAGGHATWLFHDLHGKGVWYFFPVVYFFKTPIAFLVSNVLAVWCTLRSVILRNHNVERLFPIVAALAVLVSSMASNINIGIRHILPVYMLLSVPAGYGLLWLWQQKKHISKAPKIVFVILLCWQLFDYLTAFPDRISYYNTFGYVLTDGRPERISPDSDVDWGQGFLQLSEVIEARKITDLQTCFWLGGSIRNMQQTLKIPYKGCPASLPSGWLAVSRVELLLYPEKYTWLNPYKPVKNVGDTILLYHFP
ncbi:MAG: hypothetical protein EBR02_04475 [Alphaproteobacteria bacterium]|nr:hypothetical protein [Alphaproteobacteria bacterium]